MNEQAISAHNLFQRLQLCFPAPAYITLEEVRDATGFDGVRTADAMAISLYRSRGKAIYGFEMKVSRADWLKELKQPAKAESIMRYCHHWALVVPDADLVKEGELPSTWGMYVAHRDKLKCVVRPPLLEPLPMTMTIFTALAYAINQRQTKADAAALDAKYNEGFAAGKNAALSNREHYEKYYNDLRERVEIFEKHSGIQIRYGMSKSTEKVGDAVRTILEADNGLTRCLADYRWAYNHSKNLTGELEKSLALIQGLIDKSKSPAEETA